MSDCVSCVLHKIKTSRMNREVREKCGKAVFYAPEYVKMSFPLGLADAPRHRRKAEVGFAFLSFIDNVPFDDTLRAGGYS